MVRESAWRYEYGEARLGYDARRRDEALQLAAACRRQDARWQKTAIGVLGRMPRLFGSLFGLTRMPKLARRLYSVPEMPTDSRTMVHCRDDI